MFPVRGIDSCDPAPPARAPWTAPRWAGWLITLSIAILFVHGFHPFAEDGGLYAAGIEYKLNPALFPHYTAFVTEHLRFSVFAPCVALLVRCTHLSVPATLLLLDFFAALSTLAAARALLRRCIADERAQLAGVIALAAGWTLPIAGTSLYLMDPYVTARSFTLPLSLLAMSFALERWPPLRSSRLLRHPALRCALCLLVAIAFHPLMAALAFLFVAALRATSSRHPVAAWLTLTATLLIACISLRTFGPSESPAEHVAAVSRYYWFLSQWHWYERLGLLGPLGMLGLVLRSGLAAQSAPVRTLSRTAILLGLLCTMCALLFAHESSPSHTLARLQPLRSFLLLYALMLPLLGASLYNACERASARKHRRSLRAVPPLAGIAMALSLFFAARATYPASPHVEWPWLTAQAQNGWVRAFLWARDNTPSDALFALDARYVNTEGEDAQVFRAISLRSALPDYSKDGGEASIAPALAPVWLAASSAQKDLSTRNDIERGLRLRPFAVRWMILQAWSRTAYPCPYQNETVKVCRLQP